MPAQSYREILEVRQEKNFTKNQTWNPCSVDIGTGSFTYFIGCLKNRPVYLFNLTSTKNFNNNTRNTDKITLFQTKHNFFKKIVFPSTVIEWNKLYPNVQSASSLSNFKKNLLKFIRSYHHNAFNFHNCKEIKYLIRLRVGLSH